MSLTLVKSTRKPLKCCQTSKLGEPFVTDEKIISNEISKLLFKLRLPHFSTVKRVFRLFSNLAKKLSKKSILYYDILNKLPCLIFLLFYSREMCIRFADLERKLGEIDRARAVYMHASQMADPRVCSCLTSFSSNREARWPHAYFSSPDRVVLVRALGGDIELCSWARYFPLHPGV